MKKKIIALTLCAFISVPFFSLEFAARLTPSLLFPTGEQMSTGFGVNAAFDLDLFNFLTLGLEGGFASTKQEALEKNFNIFSGGLSAGLYYYPLSRLYLSGNGSFGMYSISIDSPSVTNNGSGLYWRGFGEVGFRFTPAFVLSATGGYSSYMIEGSSFLDSPFVGLSAKFNFSTNKKSSRGNFSVNFEQDSSSFPVYSSLYKKVPLGYATIRNISSAEVRDLHVSFQAGKYTAAQKECASFSILNRYKSVEVPVYADFSSEFLKYSEDGKINGELVISYSFLGKQMVEVQNIVLDVRHRNSFIWNDSAALACFIDPSTPEILEAAKYIAGTEIVNLKPGMNSPLQYSAAIMEGLRLADIDYSRDKVTPYTSFRNSEQIDSIQYPLETLGIMSGDYDDLGILVASCLESFGIGTGFVALDDDFIVLVDTRIVPEKKQNQFTGLDVISDANTTWLPLSMKTFREGFTKSRTQGAKLLNSGIEYEIVDVHEAWEYYPPVTFSGYRGSYKNPSKDAIIKAVNEATTYYINNELAALAKKFRSEGNTKLLADTYVRSGMYNEALAEYQKLNTTSAWNNMALVYTYQKKYKQAQDMYKKVLAKDSNNRSANAGMKKITALIGE